MNTIFKEYASNNKIEVPAIQRDYVQGRGDTDKEVDKREKFVDYLFEQLLNPDKEAHLQFIYGSSSQNNNSSRNSFIPLDGQQRLTTLFLLHWILWTYSSDELKSNYPKDYLQNFSYKTRISSTTFCERLSKESFERVNTNLSEEIIQQPWFSESWGNDPTINTMLQMLNSMQKRLPRKEEEIDDTDDLYKRLVDSNAISFDLLDMDKFGLTDSLYIKMNARGKQLTDFENWKSDFIGFLEKEFSDDIYSEENDTKKGSTYTSYFSNSIEHDWTSLFWSYACKEYKAISDSKEKESFYPSIDKTFMQYFEFLQSYFYYTDGQKHEKADFDSLDISKKHAIARKKENILFLFQSLDSLSRIGEHKAFFDDLFYVSDSVVPEEEKIKSGKVRLFHTKNTNIFEVICDINGSAEVKDRVMMIALIKYFIKNKTQKVDTNLRLYARCIRNLLEIQTQSALKRTTCESDLRINDFEKYNKAIDEVLGMSITAPIFFPSSITLSHSYLETQKAEYINNSTDILSFYELEDNNLWYSHLAGFRLAIETHGISNVAKAMKAFCNASDLEKKRVLIACGFRGLHLCNYMNGKRVFFGSEGHWDVIFILGKDFVNKSICEFVRRFIDKKDCQSIIDDELHSKTTYDFAYYMLKYDNFADANEGCSHFWTSGNLDSLDLIAFKSYNSNPAGAYHTDPLANAVIWELKKSEPINSNSFKLWTGKCPLNLIRDGLVRFEMESHTDGWHILHKYTDKVPSSAVTEFNIKKPYQTLILADKPGSDRVQTAVEFIKTYKGDLLK